MTQSSEEDPPDDESAPEQSTSGAANLPAPTAGSSDQVVVTTAVTDPAPVVMVNVEPLAAPRMSHVEISFDMAPGARLQFFVEAVPANETQAGERAGPVLIRAENLAPAPQLAAFAQPVGASPERIASRPVVAETALPVPDAAAEVQVERSSPLMAPPSAAPIALSIEPIVSPADSPRVRAPSLAQASADALTWLRARFAGVSTILAPAAPTNGSLAPAGSSSRRWLNVRTWSLAEALFALGLVLYLVTRLTGIAGFPIAFSAGEANNVLLGRHVLENGLRGTDGTYLPIYFEVDQNRWTPILPTYMQEFASIILGSSVLVARTTNAIFSLGAAITIGLMLKRFFELRFWWAGPLLLALIPSWFMFSRTAFEAICAATCYAGFLIFYLMYRCWSPKYIYGVLAFGAAAFYSDFSLQFTVPVLGVLLLIADGKYHWANRQIILRALPLVALLAFPVVWFQLRHPTAVLQHLQALDSYWVHDIPLSQKVFKYASTYLYGLSPQYWIPPNNGESTILPNLHFAGQGQFGLLLFAFGLVGMAIALRRFRSSVPHRLVTYAALAAPAGAALASIEIARVLVFVIPAVLLAVIGLDWLLGMSRRINYAWATLAVFWVAALLSLSMLRSALVDGPTWSTDYGLSGLQYGAKQIFEDALPALLRDDPSRKFIVSTIWTYNVALFPEFFLTPTQRQKIAFGGVDDYLFSQQELSDNTIFVMTAAEYGRVQSASVMTTVQMLKPLAYPDGSPAFFIARLAYAPDATAQFAAIEAERRKPLESTVTIGDQLVRVFYSRLSDGTIQNVFDGNLASWARGLEANPFVIELYFPQPRNLAGLSVKVGSSLDFTVTATRFATEGGTPETITQTFLNQPPDPQVALAFPAVGPTKVLRIEIKLNSAGTAAQIHIWDIGLH